MDDAKVTTISAHAYDALREKCDELRAENARLRAALAAAPRWVSVTERLPDDRGVVPVLLDNGHEGYGFHNGAAWVPFHAWRHEVTHWLELPPAPGTDEPKPRDVSVTIIHPATTGGGGGRTSLGGGGVDKGATAQWGDAEAER